MLKTVSKNLRNNPLVHLRGRRAKRLAAKVRSSLLTLFKRWNNEMAARFERGQRTLPADWTTRWVDEYVRRQLPQLVYIAQEGEKLADSELEQKQLEGIEEITPERFLTSPLAADVTDWLQDIASESTARNAIKIQSVMDAGIAAGKAPRGISKDIKALNGSWSWSRARMIAYTNTNWAHNQGIMENYRKRSVPALEWMTTEDDAVCPFCMRMDGKIVATGQPFMQQGTMGVVTEEGSTVPLDKTQPTSGEILRKLKLKMDVVHPPLHPNCACTLLPVIQPVLRIRR